MSKNEWLEGWDEAFARLAELHPKKIDLSLGRIERVLTELGNPQANLPPVIHIAGTNGKGSTLAFLASLIEQAGGAGKTCHRYTSPHLVRFNERIVVAGSPVSNEVMTAAAIEVEKANGNQPLTFFEAMTATAFLIFSRTKADFCLLETGLGGRLDATNVIPNPVATLISSIDYDHQAFLGDSLPEIAFEKAGIIKPNCPVIVAPQEPEVLDVIKKQATQKQSTLFYYGKDWKIDIKENSFLYQDKNNKWDLPLPTLKGEHQIENAGLALFAANLLKVNKNKNEVSSAIVKAHWQARLQKMTLQGREIYLDGGHNNEAGKILAAFIEKEKEKEKGSRPCYLLCAMRATKSAEGFLMHFTNSIDKLFALPLPDAQAVPGEGAKAYTPGELQAQAEKLNIKSACADSIETALQAIPQSPKPLILIAGSLLLAGDVLKRFL